ncbi:HEPN domain-containing protein [Wenyingzhuangia sp. chi5]|uniref:HEPN domain-containing protein n=1 Tax=Wenyingzhuangia gilva TaxID=3057677 RepID=A0ABT8VVK5_9FLAO|nr:HEPN domain-containing protein [Wenyingzhuangia sp. chi5]MDO3696000.1 HEPN domain-containing protein [Wenyingzhuangia sp. chi5]
MNYNKNLLDRADFILKIADESLSQGKRNDYGNLLADFSMLKSLKTSGLSFILDLFGSEHPYYTEFKNVLRSPYEPNINSAKEIINNIKSEIENGWLTSIKGIVSSEIFSDFLEMADHLLENDYKDPAAVMIGSVLEEHIRQLCISNGIDTTFEKDGKTINLKADRMNSELAKAGVYNKLDQKNVTALLDLRNKAAHGNYSEYDKAQVKLMYDSVFNFITRNQI